MEKGARRTGKSAWEIAQLYTDAFVADMKSLNIEDPDVLCRATDHIAEQIAFIADIEKNGFAYRTSDGVYFDTSKQPDYGYLARLDVKGQEAGKRVDLGEKRSPTDFALWKFSPPGETRQMEWDSPWGKGFPGWHIECSAMAQKYLGDYFDIHCGGEDHIPVHHTNEIAQTEARVGTRLANFWLHGYFLLSNDAKMAKSAGEFLRIPYLVERGYDPLAYRYLCLTAHYRGQLNFTWDALDAAAVALDRMRQGVYALRDAGEEDADAALAERFTNELNDDLNVPRALAVAWETLRGDCAPAVKRATLLTSTGYSGCVSRDGLPGRRRRRMPSRRSPKQGSPRAARRPGPKRIGCVRNCTRPDGRWKIGPTATRSRRNERAARRDERAAPNGRNG
jgi:cysteinyl-tRNA synthetase